VPLVGEEARDHRREHRVGDARAGAEQIGSAWACRHSVQIATMRSTSACARDHSLNFGKWPLMFIGSDERSALNPSAFRRRSPGSAHGPRGRPAAMRLRV